jgi:hypothetical protein
VPPVISLALPGTATGHVQIFIVDDDGGVFHLVPSPSRPDGAVSAVATAEIDGRRAVEVSLAPDDPGFPSRGIPVLWIDPKQDRDGQTLMRDGKPVYNDNVLVAIVSETPLWEEPFASEHVNAFAASASAMSSGWSASGSPNDPDRRPLRGSSRWSGRDR